MRQCRVLLLARRLCKASMRRVQVVLHRLLRQRLFNRTSLLPRKVLRLRYSTNLARRFMHNLECRNKSRPQEFEIRLLRLISKLLVCRHSKLCMAMYIPRLGIHLVNMVCTPHGLGHQGVYR